MNPSAFYVKLCRLLNTTILSNAKLIIALVSVMSWHSGHGLQIGETNLKRGKMNSAYEKLDLRS